MNPAFDRHATWRTSVHELIAIFRDALRTLIPTLERGHIAWRSPDAYESWDAIAETLYKTMVIDSINWGLPPDGPDTLHVPVYELLYFSYAEMSYVEVLSPSLEAIRASGCHYLFHGLATTDTPFDTVECVMVDEAGDAMSGTFAEIPFEEVTFRFRHRLENGSVEIHDELDVLL